MGKAGGKPSPLLAQTTEAVRAGSIRSPLTLWLAENHDEIAAAIETHGANWHRLSRVWIDGGLIAKPADFDAPGEVGTAARNRVALSAKRAWFRLHARVMASRSNAEAAKPTLTAKKTTPSPKRPAEKPALDDGAEEDGGPRFGLAKVRK